MAKRIHMTQQAPFDYMPLRAGLGLITQQELKTYEETRLLYTDKRHHPLNEGPNIRFCPKVYTTRTRPLSGEYLVVEGSRYKAQPVEPEIRFRAHPEFDFTWNEHITPEHFHMILGRGDLTYPELDLGVKGATYDELRDLLLRLNKKATMETPFYVNHLEPLEPLR